GFKPVVGDWNGDGSSTIGVFNAANGQWLLRNSNSPGAPDIAPFSFGAGSWTPIPGDWNTDGVDTVGVFDPGTGNWYERNSNTPGNPNIGPFSYGASPFKPVSGNWKSTFAAPLLAAGAPPTATDEPVLTTTQLQTVVDAALTRIRAAGADPALVKLL